MNLKTVFLASLAVVMAIPIASSAKDGDDNPLDPSPSRRQILVGPTFLVSRNYHTGGFRTILADNSCPVFEAGTGWGFGVGLSAEFLPSVNGTWGIIPRVTFEQRPGRFHQELPNAQVLLPTTIPGAPPQIVEQSISATSEITYSILNAEILYKQEVLVLGDLRIGLAAGPAFNYVMSGHNRQYQDLITPDNAQFIEQPNTSLENNGRRMVFLDDDIPSRNATRFAIKGGVQGEFGLFGNQWIMTPGIYYDYGITQVTSAENWGLSSIIFQVDLRRAF